MIEVQKEYHDNGQLKSEVHYKVHYEDAGNVLHGRVRYWHDNDQRHYECSYIHGKLHGLQLYWYYNGKLQIVHIYENGELIKVSGLIVWDSEVIS